MFSISSGILPRPDDACIGRGLAGAAHLPPSQRPNLPFAPVACACTAAVQC